MEGHTSTQPARDPGPSQRKLTIWNEPMVNEPVRRNYKQHTFYPQEPQINWIVRNKYKISKFMVLKDLKDGMSTWETNKMIFSEKTQGIEKALNVKIRDSMPELNSKWDTVSRSEQTTQNAEWAENKEMDEDAEREGGRKRKGQRTSHRREQREWRSSIQGDSSWE